MVPPAAMRLSIGAFTVIIPPVAKTSSATGVSIEIWSPENDLRAVTPDGMSRRHNTRIPRDMIPWNRNNFITKVERNT
jgi:hypothetical protein